jgi:hypothetical protein
MKRIVRTIAALEVAWRAQFEHEWKNAGFDLAEHHVWPVIEADCRAAGGSRGLAPVSRPDAVAAIRRWAGSSKARGDGADRE